MNKNLSNKLGGGKKECRQCLKTVMKSKSGKKYVKKCRKWNSSLKNAEQKKNVKNRRVILKKNV